MDQKTPFERFWAAYPRKIAKAPARKAWEKGKLDDKVEIIIAAVEKQARWAWKGREKSKIPHAATWLNAERWEDEVEVDTQVHHTKPVTSPDPLPYVCPHEMLLNRVLFAILVKAGGVSIETLRELVRHKRHVAKQWREIWPKGEAIDYDERGEQLRITAQTLWELSGLKGQNTLHFRGR